MVNTVLHGMVMPAVRPGSSMSLNTHGTNKRQKLIDGAHCVVEPSTGHKGPDTQRQQFSSPSSSDSTSAYALSVEEFAGVCSTGLGPQSFEHALIRQCRNRALRAAILARLNIRTHDLTILG